ncbi:inactive serine protease 54 [Sarcophilus harrisii]
MSSAMLSNTFNENKYGIKVSYHTDSCLIEGGFISAFLPNDGDDLATVDSFPWVVSLQDSQYTPLTLGCILNEFWILSIASRFQNRKTVLALVGITDMNARRRTQPEYLITVILRHEGFNSMTMENNIALLKTYTAIEFNDQVQPICFPNRNLAPGILENCWVSGWIHTAAVNAFILIKEGLKAVPFSQGDPGNPVMCQAKETRLWVLSGILDKGGASCGGPFLCTKLAYYGDWISRRITSEGANFCPVFSWEELPPPASPAAGARPPNATRAALARAFSPPPPRKRGRAKARKTHGRPKLRPLNMAPAGEEGAGRPEAESRREPLERATLTDASEPLYYDYYSGEDVPLAGQAGAVTSALCTLTLLFGHV